MAKKKVVYDFKEEFVKADTAHAENAQLKEVIKELLEKNKDNQVLMEYLALNQRMEDNQAIYDAAKKNMYETMEESGIEYMEGASIIAVLKHPYTKKVLDEERLKTDLGEKYATYVIEKPVKGNVSFKPLEEDIPEDKKGE